jgi:hypothetical protein
MTQFTRLLGNRDIDRVHVNVHPDIQLARLATHGLPPFLG